MLRLAIAFALVSVAVGQIGSGSGVDPLPQIEPTITTEEGVVKLSGEDVGFDIPGGMMTASEVRQSIQSAHDDNADLAEQVDSVMSSLTAGLSEASTARDGLSGDISTVTSSLGDLASTIEASVNSQLVSLNEDVDSVNAAIVGMSPLRPGNSCMEVFESLTAARVNLAEPLGKVYIRDQQGAVSLRDCGCSCASGLSCPILNGSTALRIGRSCADMTFHSSSNNQKLIFNPVSGIPETVTCPAPHADATRAFTVGSGTSNYVNRWGRVTTLPVPSSGQNIRVQCRTNSGGSYSNTLTSCFRVGDVVIVHQTQHPDAEIAGQYEYGVVSSISSGRLSLGGPLMNTYSGGKVQIIRASVATRWTLPSGRGVRAWSWDGSSGGIIAVFATDISIAGLINADCAGFRGGARDTGPCCRTHIREGHPGESYRGTGSRVSSSSGPLKHPSSGGVCSGIYNLPAGQSPDTAGAFRRGFANGGGGGGGAGACHGGGGGGGSYGDSGWSMCLPRHHWAAGFSCQSAGKPGEGQPECDRAGQWAERGYPFGDSTMLHKQVSLGSGGGAGNSYSPSSGDNNAGGRGGGSIILKALNSITITSTGAVRANGCGGFPVAGTGAYNSWYRRNTQDGSGGAGSGGGIVFSAGGSVNVNNNKVSAKGGPCSSWSGWRGHYRMQRGGSGGFGRVQAIAPSVSGTAVTLESTRHC